ncbi:MAG: RNA 2',3'-cyclic phosphodiesterase [Synergistaceae bacterium]|jgi:2'-5' RNA ligase|nr:RNA 2',3'-cyclic phosphodiesterase [Synergistaceae bacterium]
MSIVRAFLAVVPPPDVLSRIEAWVAGLRPMLPEAKWVRKGQFHITLRFLGEAPIEKILAFAGLIDEPGGFDVCLNRAGGFPSLARPRTLWIGAAPDRPSGADALAAMAARAERAAVASGFPPETKPFRPHVTIARLRTPQTPTGRLAEALKNPPAFAWRCSGAVLFRSTLTPSGPIYTEITR